MQLIDPTVDSMVRPCTRAPLFSSVDGLKVGMLTNGKVNADTLIRETVRLFEERNGCTVTEMHAKSNASAPALDGVLEEIAGDCDFLVTASGD